MVEDPYIFLADLELWVEDWLDEWLKRNLESPHSSTCLSQLIEGYTTAASSHYAESPEDVSLMLLTAMDLWVALDKCSIHQHSLLSKYDPGFPQSLFHPLLLPKKPQMQRLAHVEQYITRRINASIYKCCHVLQDKNTNNSLAVRYFDESLHHQDLRRKIEAAANVAREEKKKEFEEKTQEYHQMLRQSAEMSCGCEEISQWRRRRILDKSNCLKCQLSDRAKNMEITVHEWPLPLGEVETKSAVFELEVPTVCSSCRYPIPNDSSFSEREENLPPLQLQRVKQVRYIGYGAAATSIQDEVCYQITLWHKEDIGCH